MNSSRKRWLRGIIFMLGMIGLSFALAWLLKSLWPYFDVENEQFAPLAYLVVFVSTLVANVTIIVPVPVPAAMMLAAATIWNPIVIALVASIGGSLGELSGYYAGRVGQQIILGTYPLAYLGYSRVVNWMNKRGFLTIFLFASIPILPFDVAGVVAGGARLPVWKFLLPCWLGKFLKYAVFCYAFSIGIVLLPGWIQS